LHVDAGVEICIGLQNSLMFYRILNPYFLVVSARNVVCMRTDLPEHVEIRSQTVCLSENCSTVHLLAYVPKMEVNVTEYATGVSHPFAAFNIIPVAGRDCSVHFRCVRSH